MKRTFRVARSTTRFLRKACGSRLTGVTTNSAAALLESGP
jgi:hypothetical protein